MTNYPQLLAKSFNNAWTEKSICLLSFVQIFCLFLVLRRLDPLWWGSALRALWLLGLMLIFSMASVILWLKIQAFEQKRLFVLGFKTFMQMSVRLFLLLVIGVATAVLLKALHIHWTFFSAISSLISVSFAVAMLACVLYLLSFGKALGFMLDFWKSKISIICAAAFAIMLGNAYAFYFAHVFWPMAATKSEGFSVFPGSATIWVVFLFFAVIAAFFSAVLNAFLVLLFLDIVQDKKSPEYLKSLVVNPAVNL